MLVRWVVQSDFLIFVREGGEKQKCTFTHEEKMYKILESIIHKFVLYVFGKDTAAYHCV